MHDHESHAAAAVPKALAMSDHAAQPASAPRQQGEPTHIVFCCNAPFIKHLAVTAASLLLNNPDRSFVIHVILSADDATEVDKLERTLAEFPHAALRIHHFDIHSRRRFFADRHITAEAYMRLYIADIIDADVNRVIYMDCDLVIRANIDFLCDLELGDAILAAVPDSNDIWRREVLALPGAEPYVNSAMLVLDLDRWRREDLGARVDGILDSYGDLYFHDQDVINILARGRIIELGREWNFNIWRMRAYLAFNSSDIDLFKPLRHQAKIIHFCDYEKPWRFASVVPLRHLYWHYQQYTKWPPRSEKNQLASRIALYPLKQILHTCYFNPINILYRITNYFDRLKSPKLSLKSLALS